MSFGGLFGAPGAVVAVGATRTAIPESAAVVLDVPSGVIQANNAQGQKLYGGPTQRFGELAFVDATLAPYANDTIDGSAADTGVLVSGVPGSADHGIPANFGPGRGNWTVADFARLRVLVQPRLAAIPADVVPPVVMPILVGGNIFIIVKNMSAQTALTLDIWLKYSHSIEG